MSALARDHVEPASVSSGKIIGSPQRPAVPTSGLPTKINLDIITRDSMNKKTEVATLV